jgi:hypothetical protein
MRTFRASIFRWVLLALLAASPLTASAKKGTVVKASPCASSARSVTYSLSNTGAVQKSGRTQEAPACVQVIYNSFRFDMSINDTQTAKAGPDPTSILTGTAKSAPASGSPSKAGDVSTEVTNLNSAILALQSTADQTQKTVADLTDFLGLEDSSLKNAVQDGATLALQNAESRYETVLRNEFKQEVLAKQTYHASDVATGGCPGTLAHPLDGSLEFLIAVATTHAQAQLAADTNAAVQSDIDTDNANILKLQGISAVADLYKCGGTALQTLTTNLNLVDWWRSRFSALGLAYEGSAKSSAPGTKLPTEDIFYVSDAESCSWISNQDLTDAVSITGTDQAPLLSGGKAAAVTSQTFITLKCSSPISLSAGVEVSGIRDQEFAIVKSAPPAGGTTSVAKFGYTTNSPVHLLPIAMANVRLLESSNGRFAGHFSIGVAGNFQGAYSGGSTAEFLIGPSLSLFRTVFITSGVHIGFQSQLSGGFNVGDSVPTDITAPTVTKSVQVTYGFAFTFTKP